MQKNYKNLNTINSIQFKYYFSIEQFFIFICFIIDRWDKDMLVNYPTNVVFKEFYQNIENINCQKVTPKKQEINKKMVLGTAFLGATLPVVALNLKRGRGRAFINAFKNSPIKDKMKAGLDIFEIDGFKGIFASNTGAIVGGLGAGVVMSDNKEEKSAKYKEGAFEFLNCMIPTCFAAAGEFIGSKTGKFKSKPAKAATIAASVAGGMFVANKTSNKLNEKVFDKDKENKTKRDFKITDCLVHIDDMIDLLIIAKVPFAKKFHADKILPLLYTRSGYEAGVSKKEDV